jgi:ADP-ribose diphosphatase
VSTQHFIFLYGTLCDPALLQTVAGTPLAPLPSRLDSHTVVWASGEAFPLILECPGTSADGFLIAVTDDQKTRLDFYELGFGYTLHPRVVATRDGSVEALVYFPAPDIWEPGPRWSLADWQREHGTLTREAALEFMRLIDTMSPNDAAAAFPQIRMRADSRLRARARPSPGALLPQPDATSVRVERSRQPYTDYFALREDVLAFPRFDGTLSEPVKRASFLGGDAVTVLPYDPTTDSVLVVRQFRHGAFSRGDPNPWTLEPVAGRSDPGETPEVTARRETAEETGVSLGELHLVAGYYPSPGAYSEYLTSYIGIADLSERDGTIGGLAAEAEDIMAHVLTFDDLMALLSSGAANTGPLLLSAYWLAAHRDRLRGAH